MQPDESVKPDRSPSVQHQGQSVSSRGYPPVADSLCFETVPLGAPGAGQPSGES